MKDLSNTENNPVKMIIDKIVNSEFYKNFEQIKIPEIVWEYETFDLFNFPKNHVARRESDSYFINKSENKKESILLRPQNLFIEMKWNIDLTKILFHIQRKVWKLRFGKIENG